MLQTALGHDRREEGEGRHCRKRSWIGRGRTIEVSGDIRFEIDQAGLTRVARANTKLIVVGDEGEIGDQRSECWLMIG